MACGAPSPISIRDWLQHCLVSGGLWGTGEKKGAMLASLPPVAVVTASVARDVSEAGVDGEAE